MEFSQGAGAIMLGNIITKRAGDFHVTAQVETPSSSPPLRSTVECLSFFRGLLPSIGDQQPGSRGDVGLRIVFFLAPGGVVRGGDLGMPGFSRMWSLLIHIPDRVVPSGSWRLPDRRSRSGKAIAS